MTAPLSSIWTARASPFDAPKTPAKKIAYLEVERLYERAKEDFPVSQEALDKIEKLDLYVIQHFRIAFGNRIMKQLKDFSCQCISPAAAGDGSHRLHLCDQGFPQV